MTSLPLTPEEFDELADEIVALVEQAGRPPDQPADAPAQTRQHLEEWYTVDELQFGQAAVWHSLEDAGVHREDRFPIVQTLAESHQWLKETTDG